MAQRLSIAIAASSALVLVSPASIAEEAPVDEAVPQSVAEAEAAAESGWERWLTMANPGSIYEQYRRDRESKEYLFQFPGAALVYDPWSQLRARLDEKYGFRPDLSVTHLYQWASDTVGAGTEDDASGIEVNIDATWTLFGRETTSPSMLGFEFLYRDKAGGDIPPVALFTQAGSLYPSTVAFGEIDPTVGQLWLQQVFKNIVGFRVGKYFPVSAYDFFPLKNFRLDFVDGIHAANLVIPLPDRGLGGYLMARPHRNVYIRAGVADANGDPEEVGINSLFKDGDLFTIIEVGFDPGLAERTPGRPPPGDIHVSFWHQDESDGGVNDGWGFVLSASQRFGRFIPYLRYGWSDSGVTGPAPIEQVVNLGVAFDGVFGQSSDRVAIGFTWARPSNGALDDQGAIDAFYRVQVTPQIALTPTLQMVIDPVRNPDEDVIWILGIRSRFAF